MEPSSFSSWAFSIYMLTLIQLCSAARNYGYYYDTHDKHINSGHITITVNGHGRSGQCIYNLIGRGVDDEFIDDCPYDKNDFTQINSVKYYTYYYSNYNGITAQLHSGVFTDTYGTLVIIRPSGCRLRTYQTISGKVGRTETVLSNEICDKVKKYIDDQMVQLNDYWTKWGINFHRSMYGLPPAYSIVDPLENQPRTTSLYSGQSVGTESTSPGQPPAPLSPSPPSEAIPPSPLSTGGPTILGLSSIRSDEENLVSRKSFSTTMNTIHNERECTVEQCINGNGVHDCFKIPCTAANTPSSMSMDGFIIWGHPEFHGFSFFSDERATLYLLENGWCTKKTYTTINRVTTSTSDLLSFEDCGKAKKKLDDTLKRKGIQIKANGSMSTGKPIPVESSVETVYPGVDPLPALAPNVNYDRGNGDINSETIIVSTSFLRTSNDQCQVEISVVGKGVKDKFTEPCSDKTADSVSTEDLFIFGDPKINSLTLYSKEPNVLYVVKKKICTKKMYETIDGETKIVKAPLKVADCNKMKRSISDLLSFQKAHLSSADAASSILPVDTPAESPTPADLQQFRPTYPFTLDINGIDGKYAMTAGWNIDSFDVKGCYYYITAQGKGINDHFQVPCSNEQNKAISREGFMLFGSPTSTLGLFSDTPSTLIIMTKGTCYKKTYGKTPKGPTLMGTKECEEAKKRMLTSMDTNGGMAISENNNSPPNPTGDSNNKNPGYLAPAFGHLFFNPYPVGIPYGAPGQFYPNQYRNPSFSGPQPLLTSDEPVPPTTSNNKLGVSWRDGNYNRVYNRNPTININKNNNGPNDCTMTVTIMGRALNDEITGSCSEMGTNIQKKTTSYSLAVADPSTRSGMFTEDWGSLVVINNGQCTLRKYDSSPITNTTKITSSPVDKAQCDTAKKEISGLLGANFG